MARSCDPLSDPGSNRPIDRPGSRRALVVLPESKHPPALGAQRDVRVAVSANIGLDLLSPPHCVGLRPGRVLRASVPEATVYEDGHFGGYEGEVGATTCFGKRPIHAEPQARSVDRRPNSELALGVASRRCLHAAPRLRAGCLRPRRPVAARSFRFRGHRPTRIRRRCA